MKCCQCHKEIEHELHMVFVTIDGDVVCNKKCEEDWKKERDLFLNVTIHDDTLYSNWLYGGIGVSHGELGI